jgi:peptide/nickel transport system permease protein
MAQDALVIEPVKARLGSQVAYAFLRSPVAIVSGSLVFLLIAVALSAPVIAPYDAFDPANANVADARLPPGSLGIYGAHYILGTDPEGRDMLSVMLYGLRVSLLVGFGGVTMAAAFGILAGLVSGYVGGFIGALIMRIADIQLTFPAILVALLIDGVTRTVMDSRSHDALAIPILIGAIAASFWVQFARTVRGLILVERGKEYVLAARVIGVSSPRILLTHMLPNVMGPVLVTATVSLAIAILTEATLSFLGVGVPATEPSLGTLVRIGNEYVFSGDWWITAFPSALLVTLSISVNLFGDWLRDALDPRLAS